jgi:hypothetical protein
MPKRMRPVKLEEQLEEEIKRKDVALQQIHNALRADIRIEDAELQTKDAALKVEVQSREAALLQGCSVTIQGYDAVIAAKDEQILSKCHKHKPFTSNTLSWALSSQSICIRAQSACFTTTVSFRFAHRKFRNFVA